MTSFYKTEERKEVIMKKKLSILIVSCFLLSTPCFAFDRHHHKPKMQPPKPHHQKVVYINHNNHCHNCNNYDDNYSYTTAEDVEIAKIQGLTEIILSILN